MDIWNKVISIQKIIDIFGEPISFHDAEVIHVKYDGKKGLIEINCECFLNTMSLFDERYKDFKSAYIEIGFNDVSLFQIDGGYGFIDELVIDEINGNFVVTIDSCDLKFICNSIEILKVDLITKKHEEHNKLLDKFLKSDL